MMKRITKRLWAFLLAVVFAVALVPVMPAMAATSGTCGDNLTWTLDDEGTLTISGEGDMTDWTDPSDVPWHDNIENVSMIVIDNGVTNIGKSAFAWCEGLTSVTIPDSVTSIGDWAFSNCSGLTSVMIPDSVTQIGYDAFAGCSGLTSMIIPDSVTSIRYAAFGYCSSLTDVTIGNGITSTGDAVFTQCSGLTSATIPDSVTSIDNYAFQGCSGLTSVTISDSVTIIRYGAFADCSSLTDVYYSGTEEQWNAIIIDSYNSPLTDATIHYNIGDLGESTTTTTSNLVSEHYNTPKYEKTSWGKVLDAQAEWVKSVKSYITALTAAMNSTTDDEKKNEIRLEGAKALMEADNNTNNKLLTLAGMPQSDKIYAYMALYDMLANDTEKAIELYNIDTKKNTVKIGVDMVKQVSNGINTVAFKGDYGPYSISIDGIDVRVGMFSFSKESVYQCALKCQRKDKKRVIYTGSVTSTPNHIAKVMTGYLEQLATLVINAQLSEFNDVIEILTGSNINDLSKKKVQKVLNKKADKLKAFGLGDINKTIGDISEYYEYAKKLKDLVDKEDQIGFAKEFVNQANAIKFTDTTITDKAVNRVYKEMEKKRQKLQSACIAYLDGIPLDELYPPEEKNWFEKGLDWVTSIKCPVNVSVTDENGNEVGYIHGDEVYYTDEIYIDKNGDLKKVYLSDPKKYNIKITGTDYGLLNYTVEQLDENQTPVGRVNFYDIELYDGVEITAQNNVSDISAEHSAVTLAVDGQSAQTGEYIDINDTAEVKIMTKNSGGGSISGNGRYVKGDGVQLMAVPDDGYSFAGWYCGEEFVSFDALYQFVAVEDITLTAKFKSIEEISNSADGSFLIPIGEYSDKLMIGAKKSGNTLDVYFEITDESISVSDMRVYAASYDENDSINGVTSLSYAGEENGYPKYTGSVSGENYKIFVWDKSLVPVTNVYEQ